MNDLQEAQERFNKNVNDLAAARAELNVADYLWNSAKYEADERLIEELEGSLKVNWARLQMTLGMNVSVAALV